ncbi:MAG TPA: hypothetical protein VFB37_05815 [Steroidobacteraceae bacterium]|nr:hypothetical protein [Steroidobacteraceae bacterium]
MTLGRTAALFLSLACAAWASAPVNAQVAPAPAATPQSAPPSSALASLDECISRLDAQTDIGYERIAARCPDLTRQLEQSEWSRWLPRGWREPRNDLSAASLRELHDLASRELATRITERTPHVQLLTGVLAQLGETRAGQVTSWMRVKRWLRSIFDSREQTDNEGWLSRLISRIGFSQSMLDLLAYAALAAVVTLAVLIVLNEFRMAGMLEKRRRQAHRRSAHEGTISSQTGWEVVEGASVGDRPRVLLELIVTRLTGPPFVAPSRALTVRELVRAAAVPAAEDRHRLTALASAAERVRFSGHAIPTDALEVPLVRGRELLERLSAQAPA